MGTNDIRRVIDASLSGWQLSAQERGALAERAMAAKRTTPPRRQRKRSLWILGLLALIALLALAGRRCEAECLHVMPTVEKQPSSFDVS